MYAIIHIKAYNMNDWDSGHHLRNKLTNAFWFRQLLFVNDNFFRNGDIISYHNEVFQTTFGRLIVFAPFLIIIILIFLFLLSFFGT